MMQYLNMEETLFCDREVFEIDFVPEIFRFRKTQTRKIVSTIRSEPGGSRPLTLVLHGHPGTGKTTVVRQIFSEIRATDQHYIPVYINCHADCKKLDIFTRIYKGLHDHRLSLNGHTAQQVLEKIARRVNEREAVLLVCFDNADALLPGYLLQNIICPLIRLFREYPKTRVVFLILMCTLKVDQRPAPDSCMISALRPAEVYFPQYKREQVREILHDRVQAGLNPGVISDEVFTFLISLLMKCGDMRVGIDLVKRSVMSAERYGRSSMTEEDITTSFEASGYFETGRVVCEDKKKMVPYVTTDRAMVTPNAKKPENDAVE